MVVDDIKNASEKLHGICTACLYYQSGCCL